MKLMLNNDLYIILVLSSADAQNVYSSMIVSALVDFDERVGSYKDVFAAATSRKN